MKNTVTIILVTVLVVFSAYYTVRKVRDNAGFMIPAVDMESPVKEAGPPAVKPRAVKAEKKADALFAEDMTERPSGKAGPVEEAQPVAEEATEGPAGDVEPVGKILPVAEETPGTATEKTGLMAEDIVMEEEVKDALLSEIQEIIAAAEEAAVSTEEKIEGPFAGGPIEEALPAAAKPAEETGESLEALMAEEEIGEPVKDALLAAEVENNVDVLQAESITLEPVEEVLPAAVKPVEETGESLEAMLAKEETGEPVKDALPAVMEEPAEEVKEKVDVSSAEGITEEVAEDVLPVVEAEKIINTPSEDDMIKEPVKETLAIAIEGPDVEVKGSLETLLAEKAIEEPAGDVQPVEEILPAAEEIPAAVTEKTEPIAADTVMEENAEDITLPEVQTTITAAEEPEAGTEEKGPVFSAEEVTEKPDKDTLPAETITAEPVEEVLTAVAVKPVEEIKERVETLLAEEEIEEPVKDAMPALAEEPAEQVEERIEVSQAEGVTEEPVKDALPAEGITAEPVEEVLPVVAVKPVEEIKERVETLLAEEEIEEPVKDAMPALAEEPAEQVEERIEVSQAESITEEAVEELLPAAAEGPSREVEEKIRSLLMEDAKGDVLAGTEKRIAVLAFDNFSNDVNALKKIMPGLKRRLRKKGLLVVGEDRVSKFLCDEKIRSRSYISNEMLRKVRDKFMVRTILAGSVVSFSSKEDPQVGLLLRLIDSSTGVILWADYVSLSGDDFATVLGLGRVKKIDELIARALDKLFVSFSTGPVHIRNESTYRIAVMPFQNKSQFSNAGIITMHMFLVELLKNDKFEPVEYGEVRKLIVDLRVRSKGELEYKNLEALSGALNIGGVLVGTVEQYSAGIDESSSPKVAINARLLDARNNRILWYNSHGSNGEKNIIAFEWGGKRSVDKVANGVVSELVERMDAARLHY